MGNRFSEEVDPVAILRKANIAGFDEEELGGTGQQPQSSNNQLGEDEKNDDNQSSPQYIVIFARAEEKLDVGLRQPNQVTLKFKDPVLEEGYRLFHNSNHLPYLALFGVGHVGNVFLALAKDTFLWEWAAHFLVITVILLSILLLPRGSPLRLRNIHTRAAFHERTCMLCCYTVILRNLGEFSLSFHCNHIERARCVTDTASRFLTNLALGPMISMRFWLTAAYLPISFGFSVVSQMNTGGATPAYMTTIPSITVPLGTLIFVVGMVFGYERSQRRVFSSSLYLAVKKLNTQAAHDQASGVMATLLPLSVLKPVVRGESVFHTADATVVQADVCNFTNWCASRNSAQVVEMLSFVMSSFDKIATGNECTRIKILGDGYIACAGLPDSNSDHAECGVKFAFAMQAELTQCCVRNSELNWGGLEVRVGVHSGQVSAGVLSKQRWAYDVYGEVPSIANLLEAAANDGTVLVSETTFDLLPLRMQRGRAYLKEGPSVNTGTGGVLASFHLDTQYLSAIIAAHDDNRPLNPRSPVPSHLTRKQRAKARALLTHSHNLSNVDKRGATPVVVSPMTSLQPTTQILGAEGEEDIPLDVASDPTPKVYAELTQLISLASLMCVVVGLLALGLTSSNSAGTEIEFVLGIVALVINGVCQCVPSTAARSVIIVTYLALARIVIHPFMDAASPFSGTFFGAPITYMAPLLPWRSEVMAYTFFTVVGLGSGVSSIFLGGDGVPPVGSLVTEVLLVVVVLCILRFLFMKRIRLLRKDAHETNRQLWHLKKEKEALEMVLRLKMPNHVVDGLFAEDAGDVFNASYDIPSCLIVFAHFKLPPEFLGEGVGLGVLYAISRVIDAVLPADGSGKLQHLEKIKTIGDVVMMGGSVIPGQSQYVSDEEVLLELLYVMEDIGREIKGEELLARGCQCLMGVHKGEVTTATIGKVNLEYDVFGTTVNTAARLMASTDPHNAKAQVGDQAPRVFDQLVAAVCSDQVIQVLEKLKAENISLRPDLAMGRTYEVTDARTFFAKGVGAMTSHVLTKLGSPSGKPSLLPIPSTDCVEHCEGDSSTHPAPLVVSPSHSTTSQDVSPSFLDAHEEYEGVPTLLL